MRGVRKFARRIFYSRLSSVGLAAVLGSIFVVAQQSYGQGRIPAVYASSLESVAMSMLKDESLVDCDHEACLALTFDDGPSPTTTPKIVNALVSEGARATFFVVGREVAGNETILQREYALGNEIGNHSWNHANFNKLTPAQMQSQLITTANAITKAGVPAPQLFRPPYGVISDDLLKTIHQPFVLWNIDPKDWYEQDPAHLAQIIEAQARPGAIIILHDSKAVTADAAQQFIHDLRAKYHLVTVSQLLKLGPDAQGTFYGHPVH